VLHITPSEREALQLLAEGKAIGDIAACLAVNAADVGSSLRVLFVRMGVTTRHEAIASAVRRGLVVVDESVVPAGR
jgi:DNA-binding CsgD family transcriptional regulator